jgi:uncharacterized protein (DUF1778 family)
MTALPSTPMTDRDVMINFRATESERKALHAAAERCGMTLTAWLREVALAAAGESDLLRDLSRARKRAQKMEER